MSDQLNEAQKREGAEPNEDMKPLPWYITMTIGALFMWSAFYISTTVMTAAPEDGDSRPQQVIASGDVSALKVAVDGGAIFQGKCVACHQATGLGIAGLFPPLAGSEWVAGNPTALINILLHGISGKLTVKGVVYNGQMPHFKEQLTDDEIAAVLTHIRTQWGNKSEAIDSKSVTTIRESTKTRITPYNGDDELSKL